MATLIANPTRVLFFTGKGGVGKTSTACATAIQLADRGRKVLLVSTDPASNLDEVLGVELADTARPVPGVAGLDALNIDPEEAARLYRERVVGPYRGLLPASAITSMEEQLSGACTVEIAAFDEFSKLLGDPNATAGYDHILFDTAPTGHTLRLLELPSAWTGFIETNVGGTSCLGPLAGLAEQKALYAASSGALRDPAMTTLVLVARPEEASLREAERTRGELMALGLTRVVLVLNGLFRATDLADPIAVAMEQRATRALLTMPLGLANLARREVPLMASGLIGVESLRGLGLELELPLRDNEVSAVDTPFEGATHNLGDLIEQIAAHGRGVVMTMGKGGVGKTTLAAIVARSLAVAGFKTTLTTTDPAAHVAAALDELGQVPNLTVTRIDPALETRHYSDEVMATAGAGLDAQGIALLEEDLRSPCTEEIAVFRAFADTVARGEDGFVVIDTAPTGHTLLLLDSAEAYHKEVLKKKSGSPEAVRRLLPRLRDPAYTHVLLVTLPEATPLHEALQLERDLVRADIHPMAWVVNQSLTPLKVTDPLLISRRLAETPHLLELARHTQSIALIPWRAPVAPDPIVATPQVSA